MDVDAEVDRIVREAAVLWNSGKFFACHDKLEEAWQLVKHEKKAEPAQDPRRDLIHGIILFCAAYVHWGNGNSLGIERKLVHAREALARTSLRVIGRIMFGEWTADVEADLARGARGEPFASAQPPAWPF